MLSATAINQSPSLTQGSLTGQTMEPETGEFDFLSYLLGLQATFTGDSALTDAMGGQLPVMGALADSSADEGQAKLLELFKGSKAAPAWNPIFPGDMNPLSKSDAQAPLLAAAQGFDQTALDPNVAKTSDSIQTNRSSSDEAMATPLSQAHAWREVLSLHMEGNRSEENASPTRDLLGKAQLTPVQERDFAAQKYAANSVRGEAPTPQINLQSTAVKGQTQGSEQSAPLAHQAALSSDTGTGEVADRHRNRSEDRDAVWMSSLGSSVASSQKAQSGSAQEISGSGPANRSEGTTVPELLQKIDSMVHNGGGRMTVRLSPPDLGQVEIQVKARGRNVEIEMRSDNDLTKHMLESQMKDLRQSMEMNDLVLSKMEVHVGKDLTHPMGEGAFAQLSQGGQGFHQSQHHAFDSQRGNPPPFSETANPVSARVTAQAPVLGVPERDTHGQMGRVNLRV